MNDEYNNRLNEMGDKVDAEIRSSGEKSKAEFVDRLKNGISCLVIYSVYDVVDELPIDNLDDVAFEGTFVVIGDYDERWDGRGGWLNNATGYYNEHKGRPYKSEPITNPTWLQLAVLANECIITTNDLHHVFFEGANNETEGYLRLSFGS